MNAEKERHIGSLIKEKVKERSVSITKFAGMIHRERTTIYGIFERQSIDSELLRKISEALNYDFHSEVYGLNDREKTSG